MSYSEDLKEFAQTYKYESITVGGGTFRYVLNGKQDGKTLVLLNGGMNTLEMWMEYVAPLSEDYQVLLFDYPQELRTNQELVAGFHMGAGGAAFATIFAQGCSMLFCILYLKRHDFMFDFRPSSFHFVKEEFHTLLRSGLPLSIQMVGTNFTFLILTTFINRAGGVAASAAAGIVNNFNGFAILPQAAFSSAAAAMIAQNMGKSDN